MSLTVVNLSEVANKIGRPFAVVQVAGVGDLAVNVFICQGLVDWHKHLDEDELFLVHEGVIALETERGNLTLHAEELVRVPKGVGHRSGSTLRSVVMLIRAAVLTERKNGHRSYVLETDPPLEKVRLMRTVAALAQPYRGVTLTRVENFEVVLMNAQDFGPSETAPNHGALWYVVRGVVGVEIEAGAGVRLEAGELTVIPPGRAYRLHAAQSSLVMTLVKSGER